MPETSSLQVPSIPCWVGLGLSVEHMQLTSMQTICEDFLGCTQIEAPILQFFFTQDFLKCLVGWLVGGTGRCYSEICNFMEPINY